MLFVYTMWCLYSVHWYCVYCLTEIFAHCTVYIDAGLCWFTGRSHFVQSLICYQFHFFMAAVYYVYQSLLLALLCSDFAAFLCGIAKRFCLSVFMFPFLRFFIALGNILLHTRHSVFPPFSVIVVVLSCQDTNLWQILFAVEIKLYEKMIYTWLIDW